MSSQFEGLFKVIEEKKTGKKPISETKKKTPKESLKTIPKELPSTDQPIAEKSVEKTELQTIAKSRNSEFEQSLIYLKKDTKKEVKKSLMDDPDKKDFSDLVEELLIQWLTKNS
ncbi:MAG: hypothetical protein ACR2MD_13435 [Aridibacter sp.]